MLEQFYRTALLLGNQTIEAFAQKKVAVFGLGGVGSFVVEALVRSGIGHFVLVDHDTIDITNLNRQLPATLDTLGRYKTQMLKERMQSINQTVTVETQEVFILPDNIHSVLGKDYDFMVDALDTVSAKIAIAQYAQEFQIPLVSCMGTGNKLNPSLFRIDDIYNTSVCPLCKVMRHELKKHKVPSLTVLYSTEPPMKPKYSALPPDVQQQMLGKRKVPPGSISFVPSVAGLMIGGHVICRLAGITR